MNATQTPPPSTPTRTSTPKKRVPFGGVCPEPERPVFRRRRNAAAANFYGLVQLNGQHIVPGDESDSGAPALPIRRIHFDCYYPEVHLAEREVRLVWKCQDGGEFRAAGPRPAAARAAVVEALEQFAADVDNAAGGPARNMMEALDVNDHVHGR